MRFITITLIVHAPDPHTGEQKSTQERFREVIGNARLAEELGFDGFGVGERHERPFISSSPTVVLSHIAARTTHIRLFTAVTTLSLLDPVRAFEDYSTLDHLSGGRLELIIGKGNGAAQRDLFHVTPDDQWDRNAESYEVFRRLWRNNKITYETRFRPPLTGAEVWPRPLQDPIRVWHGSATSKESVDLAARYGDPLFSANVTNPIEPYAELIRYYRERWVHYGHDPAAIAVGAGTAGYYAERNSQDAINAYRPVFAGYLAFQERLGVQPVFGTLEDFVERSSALIGSPAQVIEKVHRYHEQFGHSVLHLHADAGGLTDAQHRASLELFQSDIAPVLRREIPDPPWGWGGGPIGDDAVPAGPSPLPVEEEARMTTTPLTVLDLVPISSGSNATRALRNSIDLAQQTERLGYARYWFAEHHLNPGVAGTSPAVVLALTAAATSTIRLGSGAVQMGHRTALSTVEEFGLLDALHPGRFDLGLGRSGGRPREPKAPALAGGGAAATAAGGRTPNGLLIPPRFSIEHLLGSPRFALQKTLLQLPHAEPQNYTDQVTDVLALIAGTYRSPQGEEAHVVPGEGAALQVWILGSSGGESAEVAGRYGLRFAANYHVSPATVLEAVDGYRAAFRPSAVLGQPWVSVSADVVVAGTEAAARELAAGYGLWVRSIRTAEGAIQFPTPEQARRHVWSEADRELVADRIDTQFVGDPGQVADQLERLRDATEADELIVTTITHDHADRVRSYQLLAEEWARR